MAAQKDLNKTTKAARVLGCLEGNLKAVSPGKRDHCYFERLK